MNAPFNSRHATSSRVEAAPCHPLSSVAPQPSVADKLATYANARAQIERELGPRPTWSPDNEATDFIRDMALRWQEFGLAGCVQQQPAERWLAKMKVLNEGRRWDRAVSDRCKLLGMAPTLIGDA